MDQSEITRYKEIEIATVRPESVVETSEEIAERETARQRYYNAGGRAMSGVSAYEAGWKAAKARYGQAL